MTHRGSQLHLDQIYSPDLSAGELGEQVVTTDGNARPVGHALVWDENGNAVTGSTSGGTTTAAIGVNGVGVSNDYNYTINAAPSPISVNGNPTGSQTGGGGATYSITGSVSGVRGASIKVTATGVSLSTATDASGNWSIGGLAAGTYIITPAEPGYSFSPTSKSVTIGSANVSTPAFVATVISSGSPGSNDVADQIYSDMTGGNEGTPHGVPSTYDFYSGPVIEQGNNPGSNQAAEWWNVLYIDSGGNLASNTYVEVKDCQLWWMRASTGEWINAMTPGTAIDGGEYSEDFQTDFSTSVSFTSISGDSALAYGPPTSGRVDHCFGSSRVSIDNTDLGGMVSCFFGRLTLIDPMGTDDRASAKLLGMCGADYYPATSGPGIENNPGVGGGKFKYFTTSWRSFCMTTLTQAALRANPPSIDFTGTTA